MPATVPLFDRIPRTTGLARSPTSPTSAGRKPTYIRPQACFLSRFAKNFNWAHRLDIAGTSP